MRHSTPTHTHNTPAHVGGVSPHVKEGYGYHGWAKQRSFPISLSSNPNMPHTQPFQHPTQHAKAMRQGSRTSPRRWDPRRPRLDGAGFAITLPGVRDAHTTRDLACFRRGRGRIDMPSFRASQGHAVLPPCKGGSMPTWVGGGHGEAHLLWSQTRVSCDPRNQMTRTHSVQAPVFIEECNGVLIMCNR